MIVNVWGYLDAVLRFPSVPQLESFFCLKPIIGVILKTVAYSIGFIDIHKWALLFLSALFLNVWLLPILYVLVIPYGDSSPFRTDRDLLVQLLLVVVDSKEREFFVHSVFQFLRLAKQRIKSATPFSPVELSREVREKNWI